MFKSLYQKLYDPIVKWLNDESKPRNLPMSDFERLRYEIKQCDIILVEGRSRVSDVIKVITQSPWSHAALYIGRLHDIEDPVVRKKIKAFYDGQPDTQLIVESQLGLGTVIRPLHIYDRDHLRICRPKELSYQRAQDIIKFTTDRLGVDYDIRQILDLARFMFPWTFLPRSWRSSLFKHNIGGVTKTVCSTLIAEAFDSINYPILPLAQRKNIEGQTHLFRKNPKLCTPSHFDYSPYFDIVKYPFSNSEKEHKFESVEWQSVDSLTADEARLYVEKIPGTHKGTPSNLQ